MSGSSEDHPELILGRRTHITRRLARQIIRDVNHLSIREISRRYDLPWHYIMGLVGGWSDLVVAARRRRRCRVLLVDETSLRRGHRYVTVLIDGETGEGLRLVKRRDAKALAGFFVAQGPRWCRGIKVVITDGSPSYRAAIRAHLPTATHVVDRFHVARWFAAGLIEVRRRIQHIGDKGSRPAFDPEIFRSRYLQLTRLDRLDVERIQTLGRILARDPQLEAAWRIPRHLYRRPPRPRRHRRQPSPRSVPRGLQPGTAPRVRTHHRSPHQLGRRNLTPTTTPTASPTAPWRASTPNSASPERIAYGFVNPRHFAQRALLQIPAIATSP